MNSGTCTPNNCSTTTQLVNTHSYSVPVFNHATTTTVTSVNPISYGSRTFQQTFACATGNVTSTGVESNTANTCNVGYTYSAGSCNPILPVAPSTAGSLRCGPGSTTLTATPPMGSVIDWYTVSSGGSPVATGTSSYSPSVSSTTTFYAESRDTTNGARSTTRTAVNASVDALPIGGTATWVNQHVCAGTTMTMNLSGQSGTIDRWQYSYNGGAWVDWGYPATTSIAWATANGYSNYSFRAVLKNGSCAETYSAPTGNSAVDSTTVGGTITATPNPVNYAAVTTLGISGQVGAVVQWEYYDSAWHTWGVGTPTSVAWTAYPGYYFRAIIQNGVCPAAYAAQIYVNVNPAPVNCSYTTYQ